MEDEDVIKYVRFCEEVKVIVLPEEEQRDAWLARHGPWVCAPKDDELWDGTLRQFRPRELTRAELKRLRTEQAVKKVLPSSVFYIYKKVKRSRQSTSRRRSQRQPQDDAKPLDDDNGEEDLSYESVSDSDSRRSSSCDSDTVPRDFIDDLEAELGSGPQYSNNNPGLPSALKGRSNRKAGIPVPGELKPGPKKRWSLSSLRSSLRRGSESSEESQADLAEALPWLEQLQQLDGLSNTTVHRAASVDSVWDNLSDSVNENLAQLHLLGQSFIWDGQALLREMFPGRHVLT